MRETSIEQASLAAGADPSTKVLLRRLNAFGAVSLAAIVTLTLLSPFLAGAIYLRWMSASEMANCDWCGRLASETNPFRAPLWFGIAYAIPLLLCTTAFLALLVQLRARRTALTTHVVARIHGWSCLFAVVSLFAIPIMAPDFWFSIAWGRMVAHQLNPYYSDLTREAVQGLPVLPATGRMTYGPLWALVSGGLAALAQGTIWIEFLLFKLLLGAAWLGSLWQLRAILTDRSLWVQSVGAAILGWLPAGFFQSTAEGHNDVVMIFLLLCAIRAIQRSAVTSIWFLLAAMTVKYVTAPLLLLDFLHAAFRGRLRTYLIRAAIGTAAVAFIFAWFFRSPAFFDPLTTMRGWRFMEPSSVFLGLQPFLGRNLVRVASLTTRVGLVLLGAFYLVRYMRRKEFTSLVEAILAALVVILFTGVGHVWTWYLLWVVGLAAIVPSSALAGWVLGVGLIFPFAQIILRLDQSVYEWVTPAVYGFSLVWLWAGTALMPPPEQEIIQ